MKKSCLFRRLLTPFIIRINKPLRDSFATTNRQTRMSMRTASHPNAVHVLSPSTRRRCTRARVLLTPWCWRSRASWRRPARGQTAFTWSDNVHVVKQRTRGQTTYPWSDNESMVHHITCQPQTCAQAQALSLFGAFYSLDA